MPTKDTMTSILDTGVKRPWQGPGDRTKNALLSEHGIKQKLQHTQSELKKMKKKSGRLENKSEKSQDEMTSALSTP
jgi:hypothetical protein